MPFVEKTESYNPGYFNDVDCREGARAVARLELGGPGVEQLWPAHRGQGVPCAAAGSPIALSSAPATG